MAGLVAGKKLLNHPIRILSFDVIGHDSSYLDSSAKLGNESLAWLGAKACLTAEDFEHDNQYFFLAMKCQVRQEMMQFDY